jgi:hypothetical protein
MDGRRRLLPSLALLLASAVVWAGDAPTLPDGEIARGGGNIRQAWLTHPTRRYAHGVLGDAIEAGGISVVMADGSERRLLLEPDSVFEDRYPRLADLDGDGEDEIFLVRSYLDRGAALAILETTEDGLRIAAETPALGIPNRWLNPIGAADLDGDGRLEIALVTTPHIGGSLVIYHYANGEMIEVARRYGYSNHAIGSREMRLSLIVDSDAGAHREIVLPNADRTRLETLSLRDGQLRAHGHPRHTSPIVSAIERSRDRHGNPILNYRLASGERVRLMLR